jgi:hypothetical protein
MSPSYTAGVPQGSALKTLGGSQVVPNIPGTGQQVPSGALQEPAGVGVGVGMGVGMGVGVGVGRSGQGMVEKTLGGSQVEPKTPGTSQQLPSLSRQ